MDNNSIGPRIEKVMKHLGMSQTAFAKSLGTSGTRISNITQGRNKPDSQLLATIVEVYPQLNASWLLTGKGELDISLKTSGINTQDVFSDRGSKNPYLNTTQTHIHPLEAAEGVAVKAEADAQRSRELKALWDSLVNRERLDFTGIHYAQFASALGIYSDRVLTYVADKVVGQVNTILEQHLDNEIDTNQARVKLRQTVAPINAIQDIIMGVDRAIYDMMEHVFKLFPEAMELVKGTIIPVHLMPAGSELFKEAERNLEQSSRLPD